MALTFKTTRFVEQSELFEDCRLAYNAFVNSDPKCSWGGNKRSLINAGYIFSILDMYDYDEDEEDYEKLKNQINTVLERIINTGFDTSNQYGDFLVDLEH